MVVGKVSREGAKDGQGPSLVLEPEYDQIIPCSAHL
jgi:hypothetical protein